MKCTIPEISWHNREPVLSVDIHPSEEKFYRLATGGADCHVLIWQLNFNDVGVLTIEPLADLTRHQRAINAVRWSPNGQYLASADDDANIIIWHLKTDNVPLLEGETNDKEIWIIYKIMRGHKEDIYDLCWSPNGAKLLSGSIDNTAILWDLGKGRCDLILTDHKGFVQGVTWDPKSQYFATISTDRICRIYDSAGKQVKSRIYKGILPVPKDHYLYQKEIKYFHDDTFKSFYRRLDFSPDGNLLAVPSGHVELEDCKLVLNGTLLFLMESWTEPAAVLPSGIQCTTVAKFCPILFELQEDGPDPIISLPYRMIIAIGADHDVILYDTQQMAPFAYFHNINYTRLTDLTWSQDGRLLVASSTDGFCALITFDPNELGVQYIKEESEVEENVLNISGCVEIEENVEGPNPKEIPVAVKEQKPKKPSLLEKWAIKTPKKKSSTNTIENLDKIEEPPNKKTDSPNEVEGGEKNKIVKETANKLVDGKGKDEVKKVRRIQLIPVVDTKPEVKQSKKVRQEQLNDQANKKELESPKRNPLISFLKGGTKNDKRIKKNSLPPSESPIVVLDENEARDAWKCQKEENVVTKKKQPENVIIVDDSTEEEFSLHLSESSQSQLDGDTNGTELVASNKQETSTEIQKNIDNQIEVNSIVKENTEHSEVKKITIAKDTPTVINTATKRRIPLITLSSPKQKKK